MSAPSTLSVLLVVIYHPLHLILKWIDANVLLEPAPICLSGALVALKPDTGEILDYVSSPSFDANTVYTGTYRLEGDKWITSVEVAWNPEWVGTEQSRSYKIDVNVLQVLTPWRVMPNWPEKRMTRSIVTFEL